MFDKSLPDVSMRRVVFHCPLEEADETEVRPVEPEQTKHKKELERCTQNVSTLKWKPLGHRL